MFFEQVLQLEKALNPFAGRSTPPRWKSVCRSSYGGIHVSGSGDRHAGENFGGCGIDDVGIFSRRGAAPSAVDIVL
jgi:hypothetical protein